jgi:hypothetical protein
MPTMRAVIALTETYELVAMTGEAYRIPKLCQVNSRVCREKGISPEVLDCGHIKTVRS